jgi:hypothetical protein
MYGGATVTANETLQGEVVLKNGSVSGTGTFTTKFVFVGGAAGCSVPDQHGTFHVTGTHTGNQFTLSFIGDPPDTATASCSGLGPVGDVYSFRGQGPDQLFLPLVIPDPLVDTSALSGRSAPATSLSWSAHSQTVGQDVPVLSTPDSETGLDPLHLADRYRLARFTWKYLYWKYDPNYGK